MLQLVHSCFLLIHNLDLVPVDGIPTEHCGVAIVRPCSSHVLSPVDVLRHTAPPMRLVDHWRYYHLVRLMGRSASHIALEVARAQVHVHLSARSNVSMSFHEGNSMFFFFFCKLFFSRAALSLPTGTFDTS